MSKPFEIMEFGSRYCSVTEIRPNLYSQGYCQVMCEASFTHINSGNLILAASSESHSLNFQTLDSPLQAPKFRLCSLGIGLRSHNL